MRAAPDIHNHTPLNCGPFLLATEHLMKSGFNDLAENENDFALRRDIWVLPPTFLQVNNMIIASSHFCLGGHCFQLTSSSLLLFACPQFFLQVSLGMCENSVINSKALWKCGFLWLGCNNFDIFYWHPTLRSKVARNLKFASCVDKPRAWWNVTLQIVKCGSKVLLDLCFC